MSEPFQQLSFPFPIIKLNVNVTYLEIKKASGIGYIILTLINDLKSKTEKVIDALKTIGIASDAQYMFADEINGLIANEIIATSDETAFIKDAFDRYSISHFVFTPRGEQLFKEGYISTGEEKRKAITVYYNPLDSKFILKEKENSKIKKMEKIEHFTCFPQGFIERINADFSGLHDCLVSRQSELDLAKEVRIIETSISSQEGIAAKYDDCAELTIEGTELRINITEPPGAKKFYKTYFTAEMVEQALNKNFSFSAFYFEGGIAQFNLISKIHSPEAYERFKKHEYSFLIESEEDNLVVQYGKSKASFPKTKLDKDMVNSLNNPQSFIAIDKNTSRVFIPGTFVMFEKTFKQTIRIQLLIEETYSDEQMANQLESIKNAVSQMPLDNKYCALIKKCSELNHPAWIIDYAKIKLSDAEDDTVKVDNIGILNGVFDGDIWRKFIQAEASVVYQRIVSAITLENCAEYLGLLEKLLKTADLTRQKMLKDISNTLHAGNDVIAVFEALTAANVKITEILPVANIVQYYLKLILKNERTLPNSNLHDKFVDLNSAVSALRANTGISDDFDKNFRTMQMHLKKLKKQYGQFASKQFQELEEYIENIKISQDNIPQDISPQDTIQPPKIEETLILRKIEDRSYLEAVVLMAKKLEYLLKHKYNALDKNITLGELLNKAKSNKDIPAEFLSKFSAINNLRNKTLHATSKQVNYDTNKLKGYVQTVFNLEKNLKNPK